MQSEGRNPGCAQTHPPQSAERQRQQERQQNKLVEELVCNGIFLLQKADSYVHGNPPEVDGMNSIYTIRKVIR